MYKDAFYLIIYLFCWKYQWWVSTRAPHLDYWHFNFIPIFLEKLGRFLEKNYISNNERKNKKFHEINMSSNRYYKLHSYTNIILEIYNIISSSILKTKKTRCPIQNGIECKVYTSHNINKCFCSSQVLWCVIRCVSFLPFHWSPSF